MSESDVARAVAFFAECDDSELLMRVLRQIQPRAAAAVRRLQQRGRPIPPPLPVPPSEPATAEESLRLIGSTDDFASLQALSRAAGRRLEFLQGGGPSAPL